MNGAVEYCESVSAWPPLLEAALPKPGNVNRYRDFSDLTLYNFIFANTAVVSVYHEAVRTAELVRRGRALPV